MDRIFKGPTSKCPWLFQFNLITTERTYELYAPNRTDRDYWLRIFNIIIQINQIGLTTS